ncbi:hypothetical protein C8R47DRAFT_1225164 [Mycena vitilis]|nr:hypothetical protein C8R47DRAFT_1225164 [Mycena vitilis]
MGANSPQSNRVHLLSQYLEVLCRRGSVIIVPSVQNKPSAKVSVFHTSAFAPMFSLALGISLFLLQTAVHGAGIVPPSARHIPGFRARDARSLPDIPASCQAGCAPFAPFLQGESCPVTQCCSDAFESGYFECYKCVGTAMNVTDFTVAQEYVDVVITSCKTEGFALPVLTLPGQDPNRALASALPAGASSVPVFASSVVRPSVTTPPRTSSAPIMTTSLLLSPSPSPPLSLSPLSSLPGSPSLSSIPGSPSPSLSQQSSSQSSTATSPTSAAAPTGSAPPSAAVRLHRYTPLFSAGVALMLLLV